MNTSNEIAEESAPDALQKLLRIQFIGEQYLPSLLIGNIVTSTIKKDPTHLQISLGVYFNNKKTVKHAHDYLVYCTYDELLQALLCSVEKLCDRRRPVIVEGPVQIIIDNFDA